VGSHFKCGDENALTNRLVQFNNDAVILIIAGSEESERKKENGS
jgi:hypothetical protein